MAGALALLVGTGALTGCVAQAEPERAVVRQTAPPWPAPRDAVSHLRLAGLPELGLDDRSDPWILTVHVTVDGAPVQVPGYLGIDRRRALQAPVHTHDHTGQVWLEGDGNRQVTLGQFFVLWGVRLDERCLGAACGSLQVVADGRPVPTPVTGLVLRGTRELRVSATS